MTTQQRKWLIDQSLNLIQKYNTDEPMSKEKLSTLCEEFRSLSLRLEAKSIEAAALMNELLISAICIFEKEDRDD